MFFLLLWAMPVFSSIQNFRDFAPLKEMMLNAVSYLWRGQASQDGIAHRLCLSFPTSTATQQDKLFRCRSTRFILFFSSFYPHVKQFLCETVKVFQYNPYVSTRRSTSHIFYVRHCLCCGAGPILTGSGSGFRLRITTFL